MIQKPPAIFLMGPTASGKTALAVRLAQALETEIISVDSALVYKGMDIGTAKPSIEERGGIKHHLIDIIEPNQVFSTGEFRAQSLALMEQISAQGKIPLLVGGTMLYFNALFNGLAQLPPADETIRARLDEDLANLGKQALHDRLAKVDPKAAVRIHPNDPQRIQRALEVYEISGKPISSFFEQHAELPFKSIKLIIAPEDRSVLHQIISTRFHNMIQQGFIAEVEKLYNRGDLNPKMPAIRCVGYRQVWSYLEGEYDKQTMIDKGIVATRQLAKRQFTWLRKQQDALSLTTGSDNNLQKALEHIVE